MAQNCCRTFCMALKVTSARKPCVLQRFLALSGPDMAPTCPQMARDGLNKFILAPTSPQHGFNMAKAGFNFALYGPPRWPASSWLEKHCLSTFPPPPSLDLPGRWPAVRCKQSGDAVRPCSEQLALATRGRASATDPSPKPRRLEGFWGVFEHLFADFLLRSVSKNLVNYRAHEQHQGSHYYNNPYGIAGVRSSIHNPPTPADARGSAPGNNTFDPCFGLVPLLFYRVEQHIASRQEPAAIGSFCG